MNTRDQRAERLLAAALEMPEPGQRLAFLDRECGGDAALRAEVQSLLASNEAAGTFLESPAPGAPFGAQPSGSPAPDLAQAGTQNAQAEQEGDRIGRYKLLGKIGSGGFGDVWMAEQEEPVRRRVALKIIKLGMDTREVIARFEAERQALALMDHPNIAKVHDGGATASGRPYFVMELVRGMRITDYCDQHRLSTVERLKIFMQVCQAVQHAHQKGIIHRDIKPSNVLVTVNDGVPVPKVIDFGIAKAAEQRLTDKTVFTRFMEFLGTPAYVSPEQAEFTSLDVDTRSDIYSLGVLLYELLTGKTPFDSRELLQAGLEEMRRIIREKEPVRPSTRLRTLAPAEQTTAAKRRHTDPPKLIHLLRGDLDWIVMKCLEKDRTRRYETANGLAADLQRHLRFEPVVAGPPSQWYRFTKFARRQRRVLAVGAVILLALFIATGVSLRQARRASTESAKSRQVAMFLKEMFKGVQPSVAMDRDTAMLREIVDKAANRIGNDLRGQPEAELELRETLAHCYSSLGLYEEKEQMGREAVRVARSAFGRQHPMVARSLSMWGAALLERGDVTQAETALREAAALQRNLWKRNPEPQLHLPPNSLPYTLMSLAKTLEKREELTEAEVAAREALEVGRKLRDDASVVLTLSVLGNVQRRLGRLQEAEAAHREALKTTREVLTNSFPAEATFIANLALDLRASGDLPGAETLLREAAAVGKRFSNTEFANAGPIVENLAEVLYTQRKYDQAQEYYAEALAIARKSTNDPLRVEKRLNGMVVVLFRQNKYAEAEPFALESVSLARQHFTNELPRLENRLTLLSQAFFLQNKYPEAEPLAREALAIARNHYTNQIPRLEACLHFMGDLLQRQLKFSEAETVYAELLTQQRQHHQADSPSLARTLFQLGESMLHQRKFAEAEPLLREALPISEKDQTRRSRNFEGLALLGWALAGQKRFADAEPLLAQAHDGLSQRAADGVSRSRSRAMKEIARRLVELYEAWGKPDEAAIWREKLR